MIHMKYNYIDTGQQIGEILKTIYFYIARSLYTLFICSYFSQAFRSVHHRS